MHLLNCARMIETLIPTTSILCIVPGGASSAQNFGLALSDPYLGHALPFRRSDLRERYNLRGLGFWKEVIKVGNVGAILFSPNPGFCPLGVEALEQDSLTRAGSILKRKKLFHEMLADTARGHIPLESAGVTNFSAFDPPIDLGLQYVEEQCRTNDWWSFLAEDIMCDGRVKKHITRDQQAAVILQLMLDEHIGGWSNTFG
mmetsp:Transcript_43290/g.63493  ORF Transcript_43290/g.63493 Transcript_43290/m.63493 type:complete len:201 (-) Transcript_43290:209-811(-)